MPTDAFWLALLAGFVVFFGLITLVETVMGFFQSQAPQGMEENDYR